MVRYIRQGDVLLIPTDDVPKNARLQKHKILAEGEVTGHHHQFNRLSSAQLYKSENSAFVVLEQPETLIHEEHENIEIPKGKFEVKIQRELDLLGEVRNVMD